MRCCFPAGLFLMCLTAIAGAQPATAPAPARPALGLSEKMEAADNPAVHYKLYLPPAYEKDATALFPVVFNQNPSGRTKLTPYVKWAEANSAILVGIDGISNGMDQGKKNAVADAVMKDLAARGVRMHPTLRFAIGMSGGSADGMRLVRRKPQAYAGCVFMGAGEIIGGYNAKHLAYAILGGAKDEWMPGDACYAMAEKARAMGCFVKVELQVDRQHQEAPLEQQTAGLTWLLELQKLQLPSLGDEERAANLAAARERMQRAAAITDPAACRVETELLLALPPLNQFKAERQAALDAWAGTMSKLAKEIRDPVAQHAFIMVDVLRSPLASEPGFTAAKSFQTMAEGLRADAAVAQDWTIRERYLDTEAAECAAGLKPDKLAEVLPRWEALAKDAAGSAWEAKVQKRISIVKQFIENPSTIQKPTKVK